MDIEQLKAKHIAAGFRNEIGARIDKLDEVFSCLIALPSSQREKDNNKKHIEAMHSLLEEIKTLLAQL